MDLKTYIKQNYKSYGEFGLKAGLGSTRNSAAVVVSRYINKRRKPSYSTALKIESSTDGMVNHKELLETT